MATTSAPFVTDEADAQQLEVFNEALVVCAVQKCIKSCPVLMAGVSIILLPTCVFVMVLGPSLVCNTNKCGADGMHMTQLSVHRVCEVDVALYLWCLCTWYM
jgi:hypothetical protein